VVTIARPFFHSLFGAKNPRLVSMHVELGYLENEYRMPIFSNVMCPKELVKKQFQVLQNIDFLEVPFTYTL